MRESLCNSCKKSCKEEESKVVVCPDWKEDKDG